MNAFDYIAIVPAAFAAGVVNAVAGGGSVITFPTLLFIGIKPVVANATNTVALWPGVVSSTIGFRRELGGDRRSELLLTIPSLIGGVAGAALLLSTPSNVFESIAPYLVLFASVLLALQERISLQLRQSEGRTRTWWGAAIGVQFVVSIYGGYFGAGMGILMLVALAMLGFTDIHHMNGLKNLLSACVNGTALIYFAVSGSVLWGVAVVMAAGSIAGGLFGAKVAYRMGRENVRRMVVLIGAAMAVTLMIRLYV